jgi:hypothetical protein
MSNLRDALSKYFETFDTLREELNRTLEGWDTPVVVVFGPQNAGKSTLLERLAMMPLFPKGDGLCTRVPIRIRLRNGAEQAPELSIFKREGAEEKLDSLTVQGNVEHAVSGVMARLMSLQSAGARGVRSDRLIQVELTGPRYPSIDLLDLPGLVVAPGPGDAPDLAEQTYRLARKVIKEVHGRAIFLAVREAGHDTRQSLTTKLLAECPEIRPISFGVLTKCDRSSDDKIAEELHASNEWQLGLGYFATMNKPPQAGGGLAELRAAEQLWFNETTARQEIFRAGRAGGDQLVAQLADAYHDYLKRTWAPNTLNEIEQSKLKRLAELKDLGLPVGGEPTPELIEAVERSVKLARERARALSMDACVKYALNAKLWRGKAVPQFVGGTRRGADFSLPLEAFTRDGLDEERGLAAQLRDGITEMSRGVLDTPEHLLTNLLANDRKGASTALGAVRVARFNRVLNRVRSACQASHPGERLNEGLAARVESFLERGFEYSETEVTLRGFDGLRHATITFLLRELARWVPTIDVAAWAAEDPWLFEDSSAMERAACLRRLQDLENTRTSLLRLFDEARP